MPSKRSTVASVNIPDTLEGKRKYLEDLFKEAKRGYDVFSLYDFRNPLYDIQPAVVPIDFEFDEESADSELTREGYVLDRRQQKVIKDYIKELDRPTVNTGKRLNVSLDTDNNLDDKEVEADATEFQVNPDLYEEVRVAEDIRDRAKEKTGISNAPLYLVVFAGIPGGHASILFYVNGKIFSVGLGYKGGKDKRTAHVVSSILGGQIVANAYLYSPDYLITPWAGRVDQQGNLVRFRYYITDVGIIKTKHLDRIQTFLDKANTRMTIALKPYTDEANGGQASYKFKNYFIDLNKTYNMVSKSSKDKKDNINCTTFAETIFYERLECPLTIGGVPISLVSNPKTCKSRVLTDSVATFKNYMIKYIEDKPLEDLYKPLTDEKEDKSILTTLYDCTLGICFPRTKRGGKTRKLKKKSRKTRRYKH